MSDALTTNNNTKVDMNAGQTITTTFQPVFIKSRPFCLSFLRVLDSFFNGTTNAIVNPIGQKTLGMVSAIIMGVTYSGLQLSPYLI